jgi:hypothetical protein
MPAIRGSRRLPFNHLRAQPTAAPLTGPLGPGLGVIWENAPRPDVSRVKRITV